MMVRILSLLPMLLDLCALIVILSLFGYQAPTTSSEAQSFHAPTEMRGAMWR